MANYDLVMQAVTEFRGKWPNGATAIVYGNEQYVPIIFTPENSTQEQFKTLCGNMWLNQPFWKLLCTKEQFETLLQDLHKAAPEGATHFGIDNKQLAFISQRNDEWRWRSGDNWIPFVFGGKPKFEVIPLPPKMSITESPEFVPEIGQECLVTIDEFNLIDKPCIPKYLGDVIVFEADGEEFGCKKEYALFNPIKTEAEKQREYKIELLAKQLGELCPLPEVVNKVVDLGWEPPIPTKL